MNQRIQLTRCVRVFSSAVVLTAVAAIAAMQAHAATIYVTTDAGAESINTTTSSAFTVGFTYTGPDAGNTWTDAFALAVTGSGSSGFLYVADAGTNEVYQFNKALSGANSAHFITTADAGDTISPQEIALDGTGNLYTTSFSTGVIDKYSGSTPTSIETLPGVRGILIDGSTVWVDIEGYGSFTLDSFSTSGGALLTSNTYTSSQITCGTGVVCGQVRGMAISGTGTSEELYLADSTWTPGDGQIDAINIGNTFGITTTVGEGKTDLDDPNSLAISGSDVYVADYGNGDISEYAISGGGFLGGWNVGGNPQGIVLSGSQDQGTAEDPDFFTSSSTIPEPGTTSLLLLAAGVLAVGFWRRKVNATRLS